MACSTLNKTLHGVISLDKTVLDDLFDSIVIYEKMFDDVNPPIQGTSNAAGFDIEAYEDVVIEPLSVAVISTGLKMVVPNGTYARIGEFYHFLIV